MRSGPFLLEWNLDFLTCNLRIQPISPSLSLLSFLWRERARIHAVDKRASNWSGSFLAPRSISHNARLVAVEREGRSKAGEGQ